MIISVSEARATLPDLLDRVADGEEVTITRHGQPVAVVLRPDAVRMRRANVDAMVADIRALRLAARDVELASLPGLTVERAEELIAEIRAGRDAR